VDIEAAGRIAITLDRNRLQAGRELRAKSQTALARDAGVSAAAISQFENGHARPAPATLIKIAAALALPLAYFARRPGTPEAPPEPFFRSLRSTTAGERRRATALVGLVHELVLALEDHVDLPPVDMPEKTPAADDNVVDRAAARAREHMGLGHDGPVPSVVLALERHGVVTARFKVDADEMDAFSVEYSDRPVVVLGSDKGVRDRSRFDAAHELAHLCLHGPDDAGTKSAESQAHRFAAAFLMPADAIADQLPRKPDWELLISLKQEWHVSIGALLIRARTLGRMDPETYVRAMKTISARGWRNQEPGDLGAPERPALLAKALRVAEDNGITLDGLAEKHGLPVHDLRTILRPSLDPRPRVQI
jgi:Zn-dependent peptidase ImmA (M78 family)/transcriptional regulator with XRE-family HTH domain